MSERDKLWPYYQSFCKWLMDYSPLAFGVLKNCRMDPEQLKPYVLLWAQSIR